MNHLLIGTADKTDRLLEVAAPPFLLIDDGPTADAFADHFPKANQFDLAEHSFNPLHAIEYKTARDFATALYTASPEGENTLTVRNGKRALLRLLLDNPTRLDKLPSTDADPGTTEALAMVDDVLLSPVLKKVLCSPPPHFTFTSPRMKYPRSVIVKLDRAQIGDFDAFLLCALLIGQHLGQIILPDFGFYGRDLHISLIRQNRLVAGVNFLSELTTTLRHAVTLIEDKIPLQCSWEDAQLLARYAGLMPETTAHTDFLHQATSPC
jgi:hypothetical protein